MKFLIKVGFNLNEYTIEYAIKSKKIQCVEFLLEQQWKFEPGNTLEINWDEYIQKKSHYIILWACEFGTADILDYILLIYDPLNTELQNDSLFANMSITTDNIDTLTYLHKHDFCIQSNIDVSLDLIIKFDSVKCLDYISINVIDFKSKNYFHNLTNLFQKRFRRNINQSNKFECLKYLIYNKYYEIDEDILCMLIDLNKLDIIEYIYSIQKINKKSTKPVEKCIENDNFEILQYLLLKGFPDIKSI